MIPSEKGEEVAIFVDETDVLAIVSEVGVGRAAAALRLRPRSSCFACGREEGREPTASDLADAVKILGAPAVLRTLASIFRLYPCRGCGVLVPGTGKPGRPRLCPACGGGRRRLPRDGRPGSLRDALLGLENRVAAP